MVDGKLKSRRLRRVFVRTPGGRNVVHRKARKPSRPHCSSCGYVLHGMKAVQSRALSSMPKTMKRPERPYGGMLCSPCMRRTFIDAARR